MMVRVSTAIRRTLPRVMHAALLTGLFAVHATAQGAGEKLTKAAQRFAAFTTEAAMSGAAVIDAENRVPDRVMLGALSVGIARIEVKSEVGVRVHLFFFNPTEQPVTVPRPTGESFVLVDGTGKRLLFLSLRLPDAPKGGADLTVPALERTNVTLLYSLSKVIAPTDGVLKVGEAGVIHAVPLGAAVPPPAPPPPIPPRQ